MGEKKKRSSKSKAERNSKQKKYELIHRSAISEWSTSDEEREYEKLQLEEKEKIELLILEWCIKYPSISPKKYIMDVKHLSRSFYVRAMDIIPAAEWRVRLQDYKTSLAETVTKEHFNNIAKVNDTHIQASKLSIAKIIEKLAKGVRVYQKKDGSLLEIGQRECYPKEINDLTNALKTAQSVYRTAVGLPNEEGSIQILEKLQAEKMQVNINVNGEGKESETDLTKTLKSMSYDDLMTIIEMKKDQYKAEE